MTWPRKTSGGKKISENGMLDFLFEKLKTLSCEETHGYPPPYTPEFQVWNRIILQFGDATWSQGTVAFSKIHDVLKLAFQRDPTFAANGKVLKYGLDTAEMFRDSRLAVELVARVFDEGT